MADFAGGALVGDAIGLAGLVCRARDDAIRLWDIHLDMLDGAVAGKDDSTYRCHDVPSDR